MQDLSSLTKGLANLRITGKYSDLTIASGGQEWHLHKAIVCSQSSCLDKACDGERTESETGTITLNDDDSRVVSRLLDFLYTGAYETVPPADAAEPDNDCGSPIHFTVLMYTAADKYDLPALQQMAADKFKDHVTSFADKNDFLRAVHELYRHAPSSATEMREAAVKASIGSSYALLHEPPSADDDEYTPTFKALLREIPEFGDEVIEGITAKAAHSDKNVQTSEMLKCDKCKGDFAITMIRKQGRATVTKCPCCAAPLRRIG